MKYIILIFFLFISCEEHKDSITSQYKLEVVKQNAEIIIVSFYKGGYYKYSASGIGITNIGGKFYNVCLSGNRGIKFNINKNDTIIRDVYITKEITVRKYSGISIKYYPHSINL